MSSDWGELSVFLPSEPKVDPNRPLITPDGMGSFYIRDDHAPYGIAAPEVSRVNQRDHRARRIVGKLAVGTMIAYMAGCAAYVGVPKAASEFRFPFVGRLVEDNRSLGESTLDYVKEVPFGMFSGGGDK